MDQDHSSATHAAEGPALGFWYQALYALLSLVMLKTDNAAVGIEQLDDVELKADGQTLLFQLKHSIGPNPPSTSIKSKSLWRTIKVWIDALPSVILAETTFHLITVGDIVAGSPLYELFDDDADRTALVAAMTEEAERVLKEREIAKANNKHLPYADRVDGCRAFLVLTELQRMNLMRRVRIHPNSSTVKEIEKEISTYFDLVPLEHRATVAKRLVEWWDRQILYSLCGERERVITRIELQHHIMTIVSDLEQDKLVPEFELVGPPPDYQPDGMLARQIDLVKGKPYHLKRAIREEWKAREQRGRWSADNPAMRAKITSYDHLLREHWSDRHEEMSDACSSQHDDKKCSSGLELLRWTHDEAPTIIRPIAEGWSAAYYVRGSYQVLAINLQVGWHPDYRKLLGSNE